MKEKNYYGAVTLSLLLAANLLNYMDRQVLYAVFPLVKAGLKLSDTALGLLGSAFMAFYMVSAPVFGFLADRIGKAKMAASGLLIWSLSTLGSGVSATYGQLLVSRTAVGVGEASFGTVSPGIISGLYGPEKRGRALSLFYLAIPVGSALGYILGGIAGRALGWKAAFLLAGVPGLMLVLPVYLLHGRTEAPLRTKMRPDLSAYTALFKNRAFLVNTLAMAAMTFALGGLAQWMPTFLVRNYGLDVARGNTVFGLITVTAGITGTLAGGWLGDHFRGKAGEGYAYVSGLGLLIGAPVALYAIFSPSAAWCFRAVFVAEFLLFLNTGPLNALIAEVAGPKIIAMAFAVNMFFIHALGDALSPAMIGALSDRLGLKTALISAPAAIVISGALCFWCANVVKGGNKRGYNN